MASPVIRYTFDSNGTNSGTGGTSYNLTIPTAKQPYIGVYNGALKIFTDPAGSTSSTVDYQAYFSSWTMPSAGCTISMWLKIPEYVGQGQAIFEATPSVTSNGSTFAVTFWVSGGIGGNTMLLYWNNTIRGISLPAPGTPGNYYDNNWHHFVFTIDSSSMISVYIDKVFIGSVNTVSLVNTTFTKFVVGGRTNADPPLHGYVDEFRIYNSYVATSSQVTDLYKESYENFFDYGTITSLNTKRVNIRDIYDNNLSTLTDEDPAILVDKDNIKVEFFVGLTTNEYLPYRTETIWYYQSGDWLYQQGNGARGFVASNSEFPCIGSIISGPGSIENESDCKPGWLAFHPEYFSGDEDSLKLYIKLTPVFGQVIKKYIIYYHENQQGGGIRFATGQNYGTGSHVQHNSQLVLSNQATSGSWKQVNSYGGYTSNVLKYEYTFITPLTFNASDSLYIHISDAGDFTNFFAVMQVILEVETLEVLFDGDNLTITNSINSTDTDTVIFELPGDYKMTNLTVTEFTGTGTIAYTLSKDGANIVTGTITSSGVNLLPGTLKPGSNTLYTLTLTANAAINYTIVGTKVILDTIPPTMTITSSLNALDVLKQLNTIFSGYTYNNFSNISGTLNSYGCRIIATPKNGALAELLVGSTNINDWGFFNQTEFDSSSTMPLTYGFANDNALNSLPYMVGALFTNTGYVGLFVMAFKDYNSNTKVKDLFYPVLPTGQARTIYTYILNRNNTSSTYSSGNTKWNFSNGQGAGVNGYYSSSALSIDDGVWGFAIDKTVDANGGGSLGDAGSISYGIENWNTSDGNVGYYWGGSTPISTSNYGIVMFTGSTITIPVVTNGSTSNKSSIPLIFTSSESTTNFTSSDVTVSNGSLSNFTGSGSVYTATFTPSGQGACTISVAANKFTDAEGNNNTASNTFNWTFDSTPPTMTITSLTSGVTNGSTTNNASIILIFTFSESTADFTAGDVTLSNCTLSNFAGGLAYYSATITPSGQGLCTISVAANKYTDAVGNKNTASSTFNWTYDSVSPTMTITSTTSGVTSGSTTNNASIALTFTSTESTSNFTVGDVSVSNGLLSSFAGSGSVYTATFTPSGQGTCTISVIAGKYTDAAGNNNTASNTFTWTYDSVSPSMTITSTTSGVTSGSTTNNASIALTFTSSESTTNFIVGDVTVSNGTLSNFAGSGSVYTATFTPSGQGACTISVIAGKYTDTAGNNNTASNTFTWTYDSVSPSMTITSTTSGVTSGSTTNNASIALTFTSSESTSNFTVGDITVSNGSLSSFAGSGSVYTATFTPSGQGACTISVIAGKYTDTAGNNNTASNTFNWTYDSVQPTMTITSTTSGVTSGSITNNASIALTFTSSKSTANFEQADVTVSNGSLSSFAGSGSIYTATFTPSGQGACTISVIAGKYTDAAGNNNTASNTFNWTYDSVQPTMTITSTTSGVTSGSTTNNASIALTFTSSESTTNFIVGDVAVTNGTLSSFAGSGSVYTATFTPSGQGACTISVIAGKYTDTAGNNNTASNTFTWTYDSISPSMTITSSTPGVTNGSRTNNTSIDLTFTSTESTSNFTVGDITVSNGTLSNFAGSGSVYTATFTPSGQGLCTIDVAAGVYTDIATNLNNLATQFAWTFDSISPSMTITSSTSGVTHGSTTNNASIALTFTSSESTTNLISSDVTVSNGSLSNFAGSGSVYTATFTPSGQGTCTISVGANTYTDVAGNYNTASNTFTWTYDSISPSMTITSSTPGVTSGSSTNNASIALTFTSSESTTNFTAGDVTVSNGTLSNFTGSGTLYTATFTPSSQGACTISIIAGKYTDLAGNNNTASNIFTWTFDNVQPTMTITSSTSGVTSGSITNNTSIELTITSNKVTTNFEQADITVINGSLSNFAGSGTVYTATFTPSGQGLCTISVGANTYTDAVGNNNTASNTFNWTYDSVSPTMTITSTTSGVTSGSTTNNASIALTFTSSESTSNFTVGDVSVSNGSLSSFAGSGSEYTATFTPSGQGACTINVDAGKYTDAAGNNNTASNTFNWIFDSVSPSMTITSTTSGVTSGSTTNNASIALTFTSSETTTNFEQTDIIVTNGALSNFAGSGSVYTATFTPSGQGGCTISVGANTYTDVAGNNNTASNTFTWTFDNVPPTMTITSTTSGVTNGSTTNNTSISLFLTSTKITTNFTVDDITVTNGTLSDFRDGPRRPRGRDFLVTFTPADQGLCTINVDAGTFTDAVGNPNTFANTFNWTFDSISPSMTITSTTLGITSGSTTNDASIALTFTSTESTINFTKEDVTITNGTLSNFAGSGKVYTATFTPSGQGLCTIDVAAGVYTDEATNLNNLATQFTWTFDSIPPIIAITSTNFGVINGTTTNNASISFTFTSTKSITNFEQTDIIVTNGTLSGFTGSDKVYSAIFTPTEQGLCTIDIGANKYMDTIGNNNIASTTFSFTFDTIHPNMTITANTFGVTNGSATNNPFIELTFTSSEVTADFEQTDITVTNGIISGFTGSGTVYIATFTPTSPGLCTIDVAEGAFIDAAGNTNTAATTFTWTFDDFPPSMTITSTTSGVISGSTSADATIALTFTSTKSTSSFEKTDIIVTNGTISGFSGSGTVYTATFTPTKFGECTIGVPEGAFIDDAGNNNIAVTTFIWTFGRAVSFDTNSITIFNSISANDIDIVLFVLLSGEDFPSLDVTDFTGDGTITYEISSDGETVNSGSFSEPGINLFGNKPLSVTTDTTYVLKMVANASLTYTIFGIKKINYGSVIPTALSFINNALTIQNSIDSNDVDKVSFSVNAYDRLHILQVTNLLNPTAVNYVLEILDGPIVISGRFFQEGYDLLQTNILSHSKNTTYILTLTSDSVNNYSIICGTIGPPDRDKLCTQKKSAGSGIKSMGTCNNVQYKRIVTSTNTPSGSSKIRYSQILRSRRFKYVRTYIQSTPPVAEEIPQPMFTYGKINTHSII